MTVAILVGSATFMGFAMVNHLGGPNWSQKARAFTEYDFAQPGPGAPWTVKSRDLVEETVASPKTLPAGYIAALKHQAQRQQTQKTSIEQQITAVAARKKEAQELIAADMPAIKKRIELLNEEITQQAAESRQIADEILVKTADAQKINDEIVVRREETERMRTQLEELRAQHSLMEEKKRRLADLLTQARGLLERAQRRYDLIKSDVEGSTLN